MADTLTPRPVNNLWEIALQALDEEDKANIDFNTSKLDILEDVLTAAAEKQRICLANRWKYKKGNKEIIIRDQLEKIVAWVDKFKQIGDQIVQYDPGHAALPWAGVRFFPPSEMSLIIFGTLRCNPLSYSGLSMMLRCLGLWLKGWNLYLV